MSCACRLHHGEKEERNNKHWKDETVATNGHHYTMTRTQHRNNDVPPDTGALSVVSAHCGKKPSQRKPILRNTSYSMEKILYSKAKITHRQFKNIWNCKTNSYKTSQNPCAFLLYSKRDQLQIPGTVELIAEAIAAAVTTVVRARVPYVPLFVANTTVCNSTTSHNNNP